MANSVQAHAVANTSNTTNTTNPTNQTSQNAVGDASDAATWMPDETLRKAFATQLNIDESQLTTTNIATVKSVKITSGTISSIQGLHYATGLESITVIGNQNQANRSAEENNISQYQDSNSQYKYDAENGTADVSPLLANNDFGELGELPNLQFIQMTGLGITSVSLMKNIAEKDSNIQYAYLDSNNISDVSAFNGLSMPNLKTLNIANNQISDISIIKNLSMPALTTIDASYNQISDVSPITQANLTSLQYIYADNNQIAQIDAFKESTFTKLKSISVRNNQISNIDIMSGIQSRYPSLQTFQVDGNQIYDISFMNGYKLTSSTSAQNQTYTETVKLMKPAAGQTVNEVVNVPNKTSSFIGLNDGSGLYQGTSDPTNSSLSIKNVSSAVAQYQYFNGQTASAADSKSSDSSIQAFIVPASSSNLPTTITYNWQGGVGQYTGTGTINIDWVDPVNPEIDANNQNLTVGDKFDPKANVTAFDQQNDGSAKTDLTSPITVESNDVDTSKAGTYQVTYKVTNSYGLSTEKTVTVTVANPTKTDSSSNSDNSTPTSGTTTNNGNSTTTTNGSSTTATTPEKQASQNAKADGDLPATGVGLAMQNHSLAYAPIALLLAFLMFINNKVLRRDKKYVLKHDRQDNKYTLKH